MGRRLSLPQTITRFVLLCVLGAGSTLSTLRAAAPTDAYVGQWDHRSSQSFRSVLSLDTNGTWAVGGEAIGKWSLDGSLLVLRYNDHPAWLDRFIVPVQSGALRGKDAAGGTVTMTRRLPAATVPLAGGWEFFNLDDGKRVHVTLSDDGTWTEYEHPAGFWQVVGDQLVLNFKNLRDWVDTYDLPPKGDVLYGQNRGGGHLTLARNGAKPAETPAKPLPEALAGGWNFTNANDNHRTIRYLGKDGKFSANGKPSGTWRTVSDQLVLTYETGDFKDRFNLPPDNGTLRGGNNLGHRLTMTQVGAGAPKNLIEPPNLPATATTTAATTTAVATTTTAAHTPAPTEPAGNPGAEYFGKRIGGGADSDAQSVAPTPAPSATTAAAAATASPATTLTPVGTWRWHSGIAYTLTETGAVKAGASVAGQWKWTNKDQGEIQVQWNLIPIRRAEDYSLSPHGNHLTWKNAPQGEVKTEDRMN